MPAVHSTPAIRIWNMCRSSPIFACKGTCEMWHCFLHTASKHAGELRDHTATWACKEVSVSGVLCHCLHWRACRGCPPWGGGARGNRTSVNRAWNMRLLYVAALAARRHGVYRTEPLGPWLSGDRIEHITEPSMEHAAGCYSRSSRRGVTDYHRTEHGTCSNTPTSSFASL